jgi:hypothetical protein
MKALLTAAILAVTTLVLGATLVLNCGKPSSIPPSLNIFQSDRSFLYAKPIPVHLDTPPLPALPLQPGAYQTYPWTIIIVAPGRGIDDRILAEMPTDHSRMERIQPHVRVVPLSRTRP